MEISGTVAAIVGTGIVVEFIFNVVLVRLGLITMRMVKRIRKGSQERHDAMLHENSEMQKELIRMRLEEKDIKTERQLRIKAEKQLSVYESRFPNHVQIIKTEEEGRNEERRKKKEERRKTSGFPFGE